MTRAEFMKPYLDRIAAAEHDYTLDAIVEQAAWDDSITHEEYRQIYDAGLSRYHELVD